jgi:hypothetical protein
MNEKSFLEKNLSALKARSPRLWEEVSALCADSASCSLRVFPSKSGVPTLEAAREGIRCLLHSARDPGEEAKRFVRSQLDGSEEIVVVLGFGLGYHVAEMLAINRECRVLVIEPSFQIFRRALETRDLAETLGSERVVVIPFSEDWMTREETSALSALPRAKLLVHRPYRILFPAEAGAVESDFKAFRDTREINLATLKRFDRLWTKNTFKNAPFFFALGGIGDIANALDGLPAVVVSAGPSAEEDLVSLAALENHAVIIAVDSALRPLLRRGIVPDFAVTVDPQLVNSLSVGDLLPAAARRQDAARQPDAAKELPLLVADPAVYPVTLRTYPGPVILTSSVFNPGKVIEDFCGRKGSIAAGGSVSVAAFDLARVLGADPVILLGLELSYESARSHLSGSFIEAYIQSRLDRLAPAPSMYLAPILSGRPLIARSKTGRTVLTDRRMLLYRSWFERHAGPGGTHILNATPRGLGIAGVPEKPFREIALSILGGETPPKAGPKIERIAGLRARLGRKTPDRAGAERLLAFLEITLRNLSKIEALGARARKTSEGLLAGALDPAKAEEELGGLDGEILAFEGEQRLLSMVMQGSIQSATAFAGDSAASTAPARRKTAYGRSLELYTAIEESAGFLSLVLRCAEKKLINFLRQTDTVNREMR